eukprot:c15044_g1_i1.p1 GENE.c15044_g1_i1~~c15044_g1_i1.p1  ORF type:complete len:263 (+),score=83.54 c15044_g1_i1:60-791(+)
MTGVVPFVNTEMQTVDSVTVVSGMSVGSPFEFSLSELLSSRLHSRPPMSLLVSQHVVRIHCSVGGPGMTRAIHNLCNTYNLQVTITESLLGAARFRLESSTELSTYWDIVCEVTIASSHSVFFVFASCGDAVRAVVASIKELSTQVSSSPSGAVLSVLVDRDEVIASLRQTVATIKDVVDGEMDNLEKMAMASSAKRRTATKLQHVRSDSVPSANVQSSIEHVYASWLNVFDSVGICDVLPLS